MEAEKLKMKKQIKKGILKKTMKNVMCRPDPKFWPQTSEDESKLIIESLNRLKVDIPKFIKPPWCELSHTPKELRPKPPPIPKVNGLIFGITECKKAIDTKDCVGVLIEAAVNPKTIVQPLIETCSDMFVPVLCLKELRSTTKINFGIPATVLGVKRNVLSDLENKIIEIFKCHKPLKSTVEVCTVNINKEICLTSNANQIEDLKSKPIVCPYLYRTHRASRVFLPSTAIAATKKSATQNYIKLPNSSQNEITDSKQFMKMIVKKISSNPNRQKVTKVVKD